MARSKILYGFLLNITYAQCHEIYGTVYAQMWKHFPGVLSAFSLRTPKINTGEKINDLRPISRRFPMQIFSVRRPAVKTGTSGTVNTEVFGM